MLPNELEDYGQSLVAMSLFLSNVYFYLKIDYFSTAAENLPFLHMWSLAVEEQFYLFFPLIIVRFWKFLSYRLIGIILSIITIISFTASDIMSDQDVMAVFFLPPYRIWELLIGSLIAVFLAVKSINPSKGADLLAVIGLGMIAWSIFYLDKDVPFPGRYTLPVVIGAALLIVFCQKDGLVTRLLAHRWIVLVGLISYSVYVWHFPFMAFARLHFDDSLPSTILPVIGLLSFPIGWISWRYLERPFRDKFTFSRRHIFLMTAAGMMAMFLIGLALHLSKGVPSRYDLPKSVEASFKRSELQSICFDLPITGSLEEISCKIGASKVEPRILVFGDSHAFSMLPAIDIAFENSQQSAYFIASSGCLPLGGVYSLRPDQGGRSCKDLSENVFSRIQASNIKTVVLIARWSGYSEGGYEGDDFFYLGLTPDAKKSTEITRSIFKTALNQRVKALSEAGVDVVLVRQVPEQLKDPRDIYYELSQKSLTEQSVLVASVSLKQHRNLQEFSDKLFDKIAKKHQRVMILDPASKLCQMYCAVGNSDQSYYFDHDHLSIAGAELLVPLFDSLNFR